MTIIRVMRKFQMIFTSHQKLRIVRLTIMMLVGGFLEMLSVSLILPFVNAVISPDSMMENTYIKLFCDIFSITSYQSVLIVFSLALAAAYILKNVYLVIQLGVQYRFVNSNLYDTQSRILRNYLARPYEYYLEVDTGEVLQIIQNNTSETFTLLMSLLSFFTETIVTVFLFATIFLIAPLLTAGMAVILGLMILIILLIIRPILRTAGISMQKAYSKMNQWMIQSVQGIKELKIMHSEDFFARNFEKYGRISAKCRYQSTTLSIVPRFLIEATSLGSFFIMVAFLIYRGTELEALIPMLSAVAMAAVRLLPSANRIAQAMADVAYREPMLDKTVENLREEDISIKESKSNVNKDIRQIKSFDSKIVVDNISYHYPTSSKNVLEDVNISINKGDSIGVAGSSGAGKTTAVDLIIGLLKPQKGSIYVDAVNIKEDMEGWISCIGYIPQSIFMLDASIKENVAFGIPDEDIDIIRVWRCLEEAALSDYVKTLPDQLDTEIGERGIRLSGGQRQRIGIARALYRDPEILVFDEATSALDNETESSIMEAIQGLHRKKTMIIIAHRLSTISGCDHVLRVEEGKVNIER